jgi:hypothetical protein
VSAGTIYLQQIETMSDFLDNVLAEVDDERFSQRPAPERNPIGFVYFHLLRVWDLDLNVLCLGQSPSEDAWHRGGYSVSMGYSPDGKGGRGAGLGFGYSDQEVDDVPYRKDVLRRYHRQLSDETRAYLQSASDEELQRSIMLRDQPTTSGERMQHTAAHSWNHIGEIRMTKTMLGFLDPTTPPHQPAATS